MNNISAQFVNDVHFVIYNDGFLIHKNSCMSFTIFTWKIVQNFLSSYYVLFIKSHKILFKFNFPVPFQEQLC